MKKIIEAILAWFAGIPHDKLSHYILALLILEFSFAPFIRFTPFVWAMVIANAIAVAFLVLKEIYDYKHKESHSVELADILWGLGGVLTGDAIFLICYL